MDSPGGLQAEKKGISQLLFWFFTLSFKESHAVTLQILFLRGIS